MSVCKLCNGEVLSGGYRQLYPYVNFIAHTEEEWEICEKNMLKNNMQPIIDFYHKYGKLTYDFPTDLTGMLKNYDSFNLLMNIQSLKSAINKTYPKAEICNTRGYKPYIVNLPTTIYIKLIAYELENGTGQFPERLEYVGTEVFKRIQTDNFALESPVYYGDYGNVRATQYIHAPEEFIKIGKQPWISSNRSIERILIQFSENVRVRNDTLHLASLVSRNKISPISAKKRVSKPNNSTISVNYSRIDNYTGDKREALESAIMKADLREIKHYTNNIDGKKLSTVRVAPEVDDILVGMAKKLGVAKYKVVTALLLIGKELTSG